MLPLDLPGIIVTSTETDGPTFSIHAGCAGKPDACAICGGTNFIGHGQHVQQVMDLPHQGRFTCIQLARKRYRCKDCAGTFFHRLDWVDDDHLATRRFVDRIASLALERSFSDLAREYGINEKTVRNIFYGRYKDDIDTTKFAQPDFMGIDELHIAGAARGVITNLSNNSAIEFLKDCSTKTFREYFERMSNRDAIKAVSMDCTARYKNMIHELFPKAKVVADKFHILRMAEDAVDSVRKEVRKNIDAKRTQLKLKQDKYVLKTREHKLEDWQRAKFEAWRESFPAIGVVYDLKEEFYAIYDSKTKREAKLRFEVWIKNIPSEQWPHWSILLRCWGNWETEILEFFETPITNAYTECQNGLTRAMDRLGRGYSFDALRVKLLRAPKKQGVVTSYRTIKKAQNQRSGGPVLHDMMFARFGVQQGDEMVPVRKEVTFGVDIAKLADWLEEDDTGQKRLAL
jgi:transposase